jgi:hypothetical protein
VAVAVRLMAHTPDNDGTVYVAPSTYNAAGQAALKYGAKANEMEEVSVVLRNDGFALSTDQAAHLTIDITGYYLRDDVNAYGGKGEKGDRGEQGSQGAKGETGEQGLHGEKGEQGLQGLQGERGERGEQGLHGEKGEQGLQGLQGERGERGLQGVQGVQGERGLQGQRGEKGDRGEQGLQGAKGDKGERGAQGLQGLQGLKGDKGDKGDRGDKGTAGVGLSTGGTIFPPPGQIKINDPNIKPDSYIIVQYTEVSNGNAIGVASQGNGWFVATGSPNKPFQYVVLTPQ